MDRSQVTPMSRCGAHDSNPCEATLSWSEATRDGRTVPVFCVIAKLLGRTLAMTLLILILVVFLAMYAASLWTYMP